MESKVEKAEAPKQTRTPLYLGKENAPLQLSKNGNNTTIVSPKLDDTVQSLIDKINSGLDVGFINNFILSTP